jgi:hypothetical protein
MYILKIEQKTRKLNGFAQQMIEKICNLILTELYFNDSRWLNATRHRGKGAELSIPIAPLETV